VLTVRELFINQMIKDALIVKDIIGSQFKEVEMVGFIGTVYLIYYNNSYWTMVNFL
jgi:hypothetical protein